jgi:hypothetical protein
VKFDIYKGDDATRFVLGKSGANPIAIFGINPSMANQFNSDRTISRIEELLAAWHFDGFLMFNLYPLRNSKPGKLPPDFQKELSERNVATISAALKKHCVKCAWAAWGDAFEKRGYFKNCLGEILSKTSSLDLKWNRFESLTNNQNPRHPLSGRPHLITEKSGVSDFDVETYLRVTKKFKWR